MQAICAREIGACRSRAGRTRSACASIAYRIHVPFRLIQQALDAARMRFTTVLGQLPTVLAFGGAEQSQQIAPRPRTRFTAAKARRNPLVGLRCHRVPLVVGST